MSKDLKARLEALAAKRGVIDEESRSLDAEREAAVAPLRAKRDKINAEIIKLQEQQKALSQEIFQLESLGRPPKAPGGLGFSIRKPDGTKEKIKP